MCAHLRYALQIYLSQTVIGAVVHRIMESALRPVPLLPAVGIEPCPETLQTFAQIRESLFRVVIENLEHRRRFCLSLHNDAIDLPSPVGAAQLAERIFTHQNPRAIFLACAFEPG